MRAGVWIIFLSFLPLFLHAQQTNDRCVWIKQFNEPIYLDSLSLVPGSLKAENPDVNFVELQQAGKVIVSYQGTLDSVRVCFKVFPINFTRRYFRRSMDIYDSAALFTSRGSSQTTPSMMVHEELFPTEGIQKSGAISRGISFGNNQDVFVNSTLNLTLDGKLTDNLNIRASITDQNIPFQPEGNTQQLQDFDNVFIEIYNEKVSLTAGDVVLRNDPSHFLRYYKNVQGGMAKIKYTPGGSIAESGIGVSVAKGQFESTFITPREGVLGPYRVPGPEGQNFVIILANSERVFLDGELLQRGFNLDYVIDYNSAQITFTNRVLITEFSRIRIDYEYSDQNYSRSILAASHQQKIGRLTVAAQAYRESDNRNQPLLISLSDDDKFALQEAGDDLDLAVTSGADSVAFTNEEVLYQQIDTVDAAGNPQTIFQYSNDPDNAFYRVRFAQTIPNGGDYIFDRSVANGRVYQWVSPVNGVPQGNYSPEINIPAPNTRQMATVALGLDINDHEHVFTEVAFSHQDKNLFSDKDSEDDNGIAMRTGIRSTGRKVYREYLLEAYGDVEWDHENFQAIDRFRPIEFNRDWNYDPAMDTTGAREEIINAGVGVVKDPDHLVRYGVTYRQRENKVNGFQHRAELRQSWKKIFVAGDVFHMTNDVEDLSARWTRLNTDLSFRHPVIVPGYRFRLDHNRIEMNTRDSSYMFFNEHTAYLRSGASSPFQFDVRHSYREDERPENGIIRAYSVSNTSQLSLSRLFGNHQVRLTGTYRELDLLEKDVTEETISGRLEWQGSLWENMVRGDVTYAVANSQELRREYVFIKVPTGEGTHTWRDLNEDNVQDLDEFFLAKNPDERNFAKIFVPTDEFITAFQNLLIAQVQVTAPFSWRDQGGMKQFISKFSNNTSWTADNKTTSDNLSDKLFAFARDIDAEEVLSERSIFRSTTFFNRSHAVYGAEFAYFSSASKQLLTNGFEAQQGNEYLFSIRYNPSRMLNFKVTTATGNREVSSDFLDNRNYLLDQYRLAPEVALQPGNYTRFIVSYVHEYQENVGGNEEGEWSQSGEYLFEFRYARAVSSALNARISLINIDFNGEENTPIAYDLLNALNPGRNMTWSLNWQQRIAKGLQLNLSYDGRKSEDTRVIHTGRVQISALF
jgi:hypothetical protein